MSDIDDKEWLKKQKAMIALDSESELKFYPLSQSGDVQIRQESMVGQCSTDRRTHDQP